MKFWCIPTSQLTSQLQVEEAMWSKWEVLNHTKTMNCHRTLRKNPRVGVVALHCYAHITLLKHCDGKAVAVWACLIWRGWVSRSQCNSRGNKGLNVMSGII